MEWIHGQLPYRISDAAEELQPDEVVMLLRESYWADKRSRESILKSIGGSLCFGLYTAGKQVGFARIVTDKATFSWLCDVIVHPGHRGKGLGTWMVGIAVGHPDVDGLAMGLGTRDAHGLYEKFGFVRREAMIRPRIEHS